MAALATKVIPYPQGAGPTYVAAAAGGDTVTPGSRTRLIVKNGAGAPITVTIPQFPATLANGMANPSLVVSVAAGGESWIGPLEPSSFSNPATGLVAVAYSAVTTVTVGVVSD
jgi:hypothetical protein